MTTRAGWAKGGGLVLLVLVLVSGCVAAATTAPSRAIIVTGPPPAPLVEEPTARPQAPAASASVWITGYWHWTGIQYAWIPGHWEASPRLGATWRAPRYVKADGAYFYEPGTWWNGGIAPGSILAPDSTARANAFH